MQLRCDYPPADIEYQVRDIEGDVDRSH